MLLFIFAVILCPEIALKSITFNKLRFCALFTIASAKGCSLTFSILAAIVSNSVSFNLFKLMISVTSGFPLVIVPVLSKIT